MINKIRTLISTSFCLTLLVACGGGSGGGSTNPIADDDGTLIENTPPILEIIDDQRVVLGDVVTVEAKATDDGLPEANLTAQWSVLATPEGADEPTFDATDKMEVNISFTDPGSYQFSVSVSDGEYAVDSRFEIDVDGYVVTSFNSGLEVSLPANYLPSNSYDAEWINRMWEGISTCMSSELAVDSATAVQRKAQLAKINIYNEDDYDSDIHANSGDPESWTAINVEANGLAPNEEGFQGLVLAEKMVDYLLLYNDRPVDGSLVCGYNHSARRHATDTIVPQVDASPVTQNLIIDGVTILVEAEELQSETMVQLVAISEYLTRKEQSTDHTPLKEIRIVDNIQSLANLEIWDASGGFSVKDSMVALVRENVEDDLYTAPNYYYPGDWIDSYRQAYEDYYWDKEHFEVFNMTCCLPLE